MCTRGGSDHVTTHGPCCEKKLRHQTTFRVLANHWYPAARHTRYASIVWRQSTTLLWHRFFTWTYSTKKAQKNVTSLFFSAWAGRALILRKFLPFFGVSQRNEKPIHVLQTGTLDSFYTNSIRNATSIAQNAISVHAKGRTKSFCVP